MSDETIESTATDLEPVDATAQQLQRVSQPTATLAVTPQVSADELVSRLGVIRDAMNQAMQQDVDYGVIPGTDKPTLLKPGAEKLAVLFQLDVQLVNEKIWGPGEHLTVLSHATVFHAPTGSRLGYGEGICTTREKKYAKRTQDRACPQCDAHAIKRSKFPPRNNPQAEPGWYCYAKIGGCGANFDADDQRITSQPTGEIDNPDLPDLWNTVTKMAEKRGRIDAVLAVTGASALFSQDMEDHAGGQGSEDGAPQQSQQRGRTTDTDPATDAQRRYLNRLLNDHQPTASELAVMLGWASDHQFADDWMQSLNKGQVSALIEQLKSGTVPTGQTDVPADVPWSDEFEPAQDAA